MNIRIISMGVFCLLLSVAAHAEVCSDRATASGTLSNTFTAPFGSGGTATFRARAGEKDGQLFGNFDLTDTSGITIHSTRITRYFFNANPGIPTWRGAEYEATISGTTGSVIVNFGDNGESGDYFDVQVFAPGVSYGAAGSVNHGSVVTDPADAGCTNCVSAPFFLVSWWDADHRAQDIWSTNDARLENGTKIVQGLVDKAFSFDGADDFVIVPTSSTLNVSATSSSFTIELWINPAAASAGTQAIAVWSTDAGQPGVEFDILSDGSLYADVRDTSGISHPIYSSSGIVSIGTWQHVALTSSRSSGNTTLYLNGEQVTQQNLGGTIADTSGNLYFGGYPAGNNYSGLIDEATLYSRELFQSQLQSIYQAGASGKCKPQ